MLFRSGKLWRKWHSDYPDLFDTDDLRLVKNAARLGFHFYEWLAAILLFHSTGYLSLIEKYQYIHKGIHKRKKEVIEKLNSKILRSAIDYLSKKRVAGPDLLVYSMRRKDWFFCEVKGDNDTTGKSQEECFKALYEITGKPVRLIRFVPNKKAIKNRNDPKQ